MDRPAAARIISSVAVMSVMAAKAIIKWSLCRQHNSKSRSRRHDYVRNYDAQFNANGRETRTLVENLENNLN